MARRRPLPTSSGAAEISASISSRSPPGSGNPAALHRSNYTERKRAPLSRFVMRRGAVTLASSLLQKKASQGVHVTGRLVRKDGRSLTGKPAAGGGWGEPHPRHSLDEPGQVREQGVG